MVLGGEIQRMQQLVMAGKLKTESNVHSVMLRY